LFRGIEEIKLHNVEREKRWEWEYMQARKYKLGMNILAWGQIQSSGSILINSLKNVFISFISAKAVIDGEMTLGMMMSVQFIIGQLQAPIKSFISLAYAHQDAKISIERLSEVHNMEDEETGGNNPILNLHSEEIRLENISFQYEGPNSPFILKNVNLVIPKNKVTAIVGESGSGKTTLLRLLLKFLVPTGGCIKVGDIHLSGIQNSLCRSNCGAVMQSGFLFTDTVINNVCIGDHNLDFERFLQALKRANILSWVESLPSKYDTIIGSEGRSLSQGQKQRILIARLFYTNPYFVLLDEATSSLDANSESIVMDNLNEFCKNKTTVIIAHRLSTIKNADQIVLLKDGNIIETGKHEDLIRNKGAYLDLVEKQLSKQEFEFC
jgi:ATP-binding cassette subfamily B protein